MTKTDVSKFFKMAQKTIAKYSPEILTGIGIAGMITTTVLAVKATPKALEKIKEEKVKVYDELDPSEVPAQGIPEDVKLNPMEVIKVTWKCYIPAVITGTASIACIIGANKANYARNAALATAYNLSQTALAEYKEKVVETIGEKKEQTIREKIAQDKVDKVEKVPNNEIVMIGSGDVLFLEPVSMRCFMSNEEEVRRIINNLNYRMISGYEEYISLSEFYDEIGLARTSTSDDVGWNIGRDGQISISFVAAKNNEGKPCLMLDYMVSPRYDYRYLQ